MGFLRQENGNLKKNALNKLKASVSLILSIFLDKKSSQYFLRKTHFKLPIFEFVWQFLNFPPMGEGGGGRVLVVEAFSSSGVSHIGPSPLFSLSAWLTVAYLPHAGG
jgi:hypothetical protein